jgi:hypothetical protein
MLKDLHEGEVGNIPRKEVLQNIFYMMTAIASGWSQRVGKGV